MPWVVVRADNKKIAQLNVIKDILNRVECPEKDEHLCTPDPNVVFKYKRSLLKNGWITP
ncbi:MAG: tmk [Gammaproteobacteria bacterium]|nr:tmk [Gammaproteobacteria bacterium]